MGGCVKWLCSRKMWKCTNLLQSNKAGVVWRPCGCAKVMTKTGPRGPCISKNYLLFVHFLGSGCSHDLHSCGQAMSGQKTFLILRKRNRTYRSSSVRSQMLISQVSSALEQHTQVRNSLLDEQSTTSLGIGQQDSWPSFRDFGRLGR